MIGVVKTHNDSKLRTKVPDGLVIINHGLKTVVNDCCIYWALALNIFQDDH